MKRTMPAATKTDHCKQRTTEQTWNFDSIVLSIGMYTLSCQHH